MGEAYVDIAYPSKKVFSGIFLFDNRDDSVLVIQDERFPEFKAVGGVARCGETPQEAVYREAEEKARAYVVASTLVYVENHPDRNMGNHARFFFLADQISSAPRKDEILRVDDVDEGGRVRGKFTAKWVHLVHLANNLYMRQANAFCAVLGVLAKRHPRLSREYSGMMRYYDVPRDLGF